MKVEDDVAASCRRFAKVERPELATAYDCMSKQPCGADSAACSPPSTTFGDEVCAEDRCKFCSDDARKLLNMEGGWLRSDVQRAAMDCRKEEDCDDASACLDAWFAAVVR